MNFLKTVWIIFFLVIMICVARAETISVKAVDCGILGSSNTTRVEDKSVSSGYITVSNDGPGFVIKSTDRIPATRGTAFGFTFIVSGKENHNIPLIIKCDHPPITNPKTQVTTTSDEWPQQEKVNCSKFLTSTGWIFDNDWEIVPGEWVFQVYYNGEKLAEKALTVYRP